MTLRPDAFFALAVWQFARDFPSVTRFGAVDAVCAWGVRAATLIGVVLFAAGVLPLVLPRIRARCGAGAATRARAPPSWCLRCWFSARALAALGVIVWRSRLAEGSERARVRLFLSPSCFRSARS